MLVVEGFLFLRMFLFAKFIYALVALLSDWDAAEEMVALLFPRLTSFFAVLMILVMVGSAFSILLGFYAQIGGLLVFFFCLLGMRLHMILKNMANDIELEEGASDDSRGKLRDAKALAVMGQSACAQKNFLIAGIGLFFLCVGAGPYSLTMNLF